MISYFLRNASLILYEGCLGMSKFSKTLLIKNSNLGNLLLVKLCSWFSTVVQMFINACISSADNSRRCNLFLT